MLFLTYGCLAARSYKKIFTIEHGTATLAKDDSWASLPREKGMVGPRQTKTPQSARLSENLACSGGLDGTPSTLNLPGHPPSGKWMCPQCVWVFHPQGSSPPKGNALEGAGAGAGAGAAQVESRGARCHFHCDGHFFTSFPPAETQTLHPPVVVSTKTAGVCWQNPKHNMGKD